MIDKTVTVTDEMRAMIADLLRCTFCVGSFDKRFVNDIDAAIEAGQMLTEKQAALIPTMHYRYRRQHHKPTPNYNPKNDPKAHRPNRNRIDDEEKLKAWNEAAHG